MSTGGYVAYGGEVVTERPGPMHRLVERCKNKTPPSKRPQGERIKILQHVQPTSQSSGCGCSSGIR